MSDCYFKPVILQLKCIIITKGASNKLSTFYKHNFCTFNIKVNDSIIVYFYPFITIIKDKTMHHIS